MAVTLKFDKQAIEIYRETVSDDRYWQATANATAAERGVLVRLARGLKPYLKNEIYKFTMFAGDAQLLIRALRAYRRELRLAGDLDRVARLTPLIAELQRNYDADSRPKQVDKSTPRNLATAADLLELVA